MFLSKELINFITVAKYKSLTKAAEELFITQSPICRSIKKLEYTIGKKLFFRCANGLALTSDGVTLYQSILPFYEDIKNLESGYKKERRL